MKIYSKLFPIALFLTANAFASGRIQNEDVKSLSDIESAVLQTTGNLSSGSNCITSPGSTTGLSVGLFIYDFTTPANITSGTTIAGLPGTCAAGQIQMSNTAPNPAVGDSLAFGGQMSQLTNDTKIYVTANSLNEQLSTAIANGDLNANLLPQSQDAANVGLSGSVAANALTVALKDHNGANPSAGSPVVIGFRSSTSTTGLFNKRTINSALSVVVPSGATLGHASATPEYVYIYGLDNAGTVELAVCGGCFFDEGSIESTTAISGASSSRTTLYSTSARANVPIRFIGRIAVNETTAGTWATSPSEISLLPVKAPSVSSTAQSPYHIESALITGGSVATPCTSSPCTITKQSGSWLTSVTRSSTGVYMLNITSGEFSDVPICSVEVDNDVVAYECVPRYTGSTSTTFNLNCRSTGGSGQDGSFSVICHGPH